MSGTHMVIFNRPRGESPEAFGGRLRDLATSIADDDRASTVVLFVDDGSVAAPPQAAAIPATFDAALLASGVPADALPSGDALFRVSRRVIKARQRGKDGERSSGFTVVSPTVRAPFLDHEQFNAHWRDNHSRVHVDSSPGTCHYEQLIIDEALTQGPQEWDGFALLSFASASEYTERLFGGAEGEKAIMDDVARFLDLPKGENLPASEFVFRDEEA